ncbi:MAG TPA: hypothetical protein VGQ17_02375 [Gemmatimonadales bacterium]|jgi:hypothetical protein|nr:hypothetical protein [Gemmatimonadales bacterium]
MRSYWSRYWTRIALGIALIFALGMTVRAAAHKGKNELSSFLASAATRLPLQLAQLGFRIDGRRVGDVTAVDVRRSGPHDVGRATIRVRLSDLGALDGLRQCSLTVDRLQWSDDRSGFRCAEPAALTRQNLVDVGEVIFDPGNLGRPLYLSRHDVERWRHSEIRGLNASLTSSSNGAVQAEGTYDLLDHGSSRQGSFSLKADSQGAVVSVRDGQGRAVLDLRADQHGLNLKVRK